MGALADAILAIHFLLVTFVVGGQVLILAGGPLGWRWVRNLWFRLVHLAMVVFIALQTWLGNVCPLTEWENDLRAAAGQPVYEQTFVEHWLSGVMFFDLPWWMFVAGYTGFALLVVGSWWWWPPVRQAQASR